MITKEARPCSFLPTAIANELRRAIRFDLLGDAEAGPLTDVQTWVPEHEVDLFSRLYQYEKVLKKFKDPTKSSDSQRVQAIKKFLAVMEHCAGFDPCLPDTAVCVSQRHVKRRDIILYRARNFIHEVLGRIDTIDFFRACKNGSGVTQGVTFEDPSSLSKWTYPITATVEQLSVFRSYLKWDRGLHDAIVSVNGGKPLLFKILPGSKGTTVPKNDEIDRFIATETTVGMYLQQGLMSVYYGRLADFGWNVDKLQDVHREMARIFSLTLQGGTVDFSSMSDTVLTQVVKFLWPSEHYYLLNRLRSPCISVPKIGTDGEIVEDEFETYDCPMFSSMGNATTFPIETLMLLSIAQAVTDPDVGRSILPRLYPVDGVSVYGDDCLLPSSHVNEFVSVCESLGCIVNKDKTFFGNFTSFRESCGGDYMHGHNVRPVFINEPTGVRRTDLEAWLYNIFNSFKTKYTSYFGTVGYLYASNLWETLFSLFRDFGITPNVVPDSFPDDSGIKILDDYDHARWIANYGDVFHWPRVSSHGSLLINYTRWKYNDVTSSFPRPIKKKKQLTEKLIKVFLRRRKLSETIAYAEFARNGLTYNGAMARLLNQQAQCHGKCKVLSNRFVDLPFEDQPFPPKHVFERKRIGGYVPGVAVHFGPLSLNFRDVNKFMEKLI